MRIKYRPHSKRLLRLFSIAEIKGKPNEIIMADVFLSHCEYGTAIVDDDTLLVYVEDKADYDGLKEEYFKMKKILGYR